MRKWNWFFRTDEETKWVKMHGAVKGISKLFNERINETIKNSTYFYEWTECLAMQCDSNLQVEQKDKDTRHD